MAAQFPHPLMCGQARLPARSGQDLGLGLRLGRRDGHPAVLSGPGLSAPLLGRTQVLGMGGEHHLQHLGQVLQQVEAVGDLNCPRRTVAGALGVGAGAIAGDHLHAGMAAQPCGQRVRLAAGQQRHWAALVEVHQHRAVAVPLAQRPVVHAKGGRCCEVGHWRSPDEAQQRVAAGVQPELAAKAHAGRAAERQAQGREPPSKARRLARPGRCDAGQAFSE